ncbi:MAG: ECF-type sigma factor, partial [Planctomycetota bacterium]
MRDGDERAAQELWARFSPRLVKLARSRLRRLGMKLGRSEEDFALSAFNQFCQNLSGGRYEGVEDRDSLWRILAVMTRRKINDSVKIQSAQKRGGKGHVEVEITEDIADQSQSPDLAVELTDQFEQLLNLLDDPVLERVVLLKVEGYTNEEIVDELQASSRTVQRMMRLVRSVWERH